MTADTSASERPLGLHQITVMEAEPPELVSIASALGCQQVCIFTNIPIFEGAEPANTASPFPLVTHSNKQELLARLKGLGLIAACRTQR